MLHLDPSTAPGLADALLHAAPLWTAGVWTLAALCAAALKGGK